MSARMECGICWWVYDPAEGDEVRQIDAGTDFGALPDDWHCPRCDAPQMKFLPVDAGALDPVTQLRKAFEHIGEAKMRGLEVYNEALEVETVGFRPHGDGWLGVLVTPWVISAVHLPSPAAAEALEQDASVELELPAGRFRFEVTTAPGVGPLATLSLLSPPEEVPDQPSARALAETVLDELRRVPEPPEVDPARRRFLAGAWR